MTSELFLIGFLQIKLINAGLALQEYCTKINQLNESNANQIKQQYPWLCLILQGPYSSYWVFNIRIKSINESIN